MKILAQWVPVCLHCLKLYKSLSVLLSCPVYRFYPPSHPAGDGGVRTAPAVVTDGAAVQEDVALPGPGPAHQFCPVPSQYQ